MSETLDRVLADLADVQDAILDLPPEDVAGHLELRERQEGLRARAREVRGGAADELTALQVRARLAHLEARKEEHLGRRLGHLAAAQTGHGGGIDPGIVHRMHREMDAAFGLDDLDREIERLRHLLAGIGRGD